MGKPGQSNSLLLTHLASDFFEVSGTGELHRLSRIDLLDLPAEIREGHFYGGDLAGNELQSERVTPSAEDSAYRAIHEMKIDSECDLFQLQNLSQLITTFWEFAFL